MIYTATTLDYPIKRTDIPCMHPTDEWHSHPILGVKMYKMLGHIFFPDEEYLVWVDGNIWPMIPEEELVEKYLKGFDLALLKHPQRNCVYEEFEVLLQDVRFKDNAWLIKQLEAQMQAYKNTFFYPVYGGLWETGLIIRRNTPKVNSLFEAWWAEICRWQYRDQVSFPFVLMQHQDNDIEFRTIGTGDIRTNPDFKYIAHN